MTTARQNLRISLRALGVAATTVALGATLGAPSQAQGQGQGPTHSEAMPAAPAAKQVSRADVDGDGRRDTTTLAPARANGAAAVVVRTVTARGKSSSILIGTPFLPANKAWFGAAGIDGTRGVELVVRSQYGAHSESFRVITWRGGKLLIQREPSTRSTDWLTDTSVTTSAGFRASTIRGVRTLVSTAYLRSGSKMTSNATTSTWRRGAWRVVSTKKATLTFNARTFAAAYGWHVAGLPVG